MDRLNLSRYSAGMTAQKWKSGSATPGDNLGHELFPR